MASTGSYGETEPIIEGGCSPGWRIEYHGESNLQEQQKQQQRQQQQQQQGQQQLQLCTLWHTPSSFCTPAQLLHMRADIFLALQSEFKSSSSGLSLHPAHNAMRQYSAVIGLTRQPRLLPFLFSDSDPLACSVLSSLVGESLSSGGREVALLDRLDLAECLGGTLMGQLGVGGDVMVDISVTSLLQEACIAAELGLQSVQSLFQTMVSGCVPVCPVPSESTPVQTYHPHAIPSSQETDPIPFQRAVDILKQHIYWIPTSQLGMLLRQPTLQPVHTSHTHFQYGCGGEVECFTLPSLPLQDLLQWYQTELVCSLLSPDTLTQDVCHVLENVLN